MIRDLVSSSVNSVNDMLPLRYSGIVRESAESLVVSTVKEQLNRRQQGQTTENITRNFIRLDSRTIIFYQSSPFRFLTFACGLVEVRLAASQKLEMWLINPKLSR